MTGPPEYLDWDMWTGPAPMRPYNTLVHPRRWRSFMEYSNGIVGDMCIHMFDMVRWMLDLGWPKRISSTGGILVDKAEQGQHLRHADGHVRLRRPAGRLAASHLGRRSRSRSIPGARRSTATRGRCKASVIQLRFHPDGRRDDPARTSPTSWKQYPEDKTEKDLEKHVAPAIRGHMQDFLQCIDDRSRPVADIEQGHISTASCILANLAMQLGRTLALGSGETRGRGGRRGQPAAAPSLSRSVGPSRSVIHAVGVLATTLFAAADCVPLCAR